MGENVGDIKEIAKGNCSRKIANVEWEPCCFSIFYILLIVL